MSPFALQLRLTATFETEMEDQKLHFSRYCKQRVEHMVSIGVERMTMDKVTEQQEKICLTERNIKRLIEYLSDQAKVYGSFPDLEDLAFDMAMAECYPLWPFV